MATKLGKIVADFTTSLASAIAIGGTTATLQSNTDDDGETLPDGLYYFALDGGNSQKEFIQCTKTGVNLTAIQSVSRQGALTAGCVRAHRVGATVALTDFAYILYMQDLLDGTTKLNASTPLEYDGTASITLQNQLATKAYADALAIAGAPDASTTVKGLVEEATQAEVDARTVSGGTGAKLFAPLDKIRSSKYSDPLASTGSSNAYALTVVPAITAYATGQEFTFIANFDNTGSATLNVSGVGAKTIKKIDGTTDLTSYDIVTGQVVKCVYDGTSMCMVSPTFNTLTTGNNIYGNGADGAMTANGSTTYNSFSSLAANVYTLTRDAYLTDLTISTGVTIATAGYMLFVNGVLTRNGTGLIRHNGSNGGNGGNGADSSGSVGGAGGTAGAAGAAAAGVTVPAGAAGSPGNVGATGLSYNGGNGNVGGTPATGVAAANSLGNSGVSYTGVSGSGGTGSYSGASGGTNASPGTATASSARISDSIMARYLASYVSGTLTQFKANAGNGGGAGGSSGGAPNSGGTGGTGGGGGGGGSGSNGGWVVVFARRIVDNNAGVTLFQAKGGNGGNGGNAGIPTLAGPSGGSGGGSMGAGGNGGYVLVVYKSKSGTITYDVSAGSNGINGTSSNGINGGTNGAAPTTSVTPIAGQTQELQII